MTPCGNWGLRVGKTEPGTGNAIGKVLERHGVIKPALDYQLIIRD